MNALVRERHSGKHRPPREAREGDAWFRLSSWHKTALNIRRQAQDLGINHEIPDFVGDLLQRAIAAGYGDEDIAAVVKVLRQG